ncbi:Ankyrin [Thalassoporum mexicanum PCC 7367]|uniref:ankyrin repeat domain-containing protein n=1 Tax=Thalassoporum mexicanum TaxID=3457544 RepID=UPI00029FA517|nr:ankyrin repeat domain-containing protein [Pseudanabaena sp. PCC 7367]AFY68361.1 Ankyrin [Pseudanabaena sp. PCC 7367]
MPIELASKANYRLNISSLAIASLLSLSLSLLITNPGRSQEPFSQLDLQEINEFDQFQTNYQRDLQLLELARTGQTEAIRSLVRQGANPNIRDQYGWTPMLWASVNGHTDTVRALIALGGDVNLPNDYNWTPLMWAAGSGHNEIVRILLAVGASTLAEDSNGWTPLMWAWDGRHFDTVELIKNAPSFD